MLYKMQGRGRGGGTHGLYDTGGGDGVGTRMGFRKRTGVTERDHCNRRKRSVLVAFCHCGKTP